MALFKRTMVALEIKTVQSYSDPIVHITVDKGERDVPKVFKAFCRRWRRTRKSIPNISDSTYVCLIIIHEVIEPTCLTSPR